MNIDLFAVRFSLLIFYSSFLFLIYGSRSVCMYVCIFVCISVCTCERMFVFSCKFTAVANVRSGIDCMCNLFGNARIFA